MVQTRDLFVFYAVVVSHACCSNGVLMKLFTHDFLGAKSDDWQEKAASVLRLTVLTDIIWRRKKTPGKNKSYYLETSYYTQQK